MAIFDRLRASGLLHPLTRFGTWRLEKTTLLYSLVLGAVAFIVLYPLWLLFAQAFQVGAGTADTTWGLDNWRAAWTEPALAGSLANTIGLALTRQALALAVGIPVAWLIARTDLPGRGWFEFGFWVAVFLPSVPILVGWILIFDGYNGLANKLLEGLPFVQRGPFDIFSWWGIVLTHLFGATLGIKVMFLAPAFRSLDSALEEAGRMSGANSITTLRRVVLPLLAPAILVVTLLGLIQSLEAFEIELILGAPAGIDVFSTKIYRLLREQPPAYGSATALSMLILFMMTPLILFQQRLIDRGHYATITGKHGARLHALGPWKWPASAAIGTLVVAMTVVPSTFVILGSFMKIFGAFQIPNPWTLQHWTTVLASSGFLSSLATTLILAISASVVAMSIFGILGYITVRTGFLGRGALDFLTWMPSLLPGIVISLGLLWMFLSTPAFRPLYGSTAVLVIAISLSIMTRSVQMVKAALVQIGAELEQAAWMSGAGWWTTVRRVIFPLAAPTLMVVGILAFSTASRTASHVALLATANNRPLVLLQLDFLSDGNFEASSVVGVVILLLTLGAALLARALGQQTIVRE